MSIRSRVAIPVIQLKVTYGYAPNIRTITQPVSVSTLNLGLNSIKIEDPKLLREIKANPELKLYPSVVINSTLSPNFSDIVVGQTYYPPEKTYSENMFSDDHFLPIFEPDPLVGLLNDSIGLLNDSTINDVVDFGSSFTIHDAFNNNYTQPCPPGKTYINMGTMGGYCM